MKKEHNGRFSGSGSRSNIKKIVIVRKEATYGRDKLIEEIRWITRLPKPLRNRFVEIKHFDISSSLSAYYDMPYYNLPSFRKLIIGKKTSHKENIQLLQQIFDFMFDEVYTRRIKKVKKNYAKRIHIDRTRKRLRGTMDKSPILAKLIQAKSICVNGRNIQNIFTTLNEIESNSNLLRSLQPEHIRMVHGDLHFANILINLKSNNFILLDPRGLDYDYTYDLGKMWHSVYGLYDFFHEGYFDLDIDYSNKEIDARYKIHKLPSLAEFNRIYNRLKNMLNRYDLVKNDAQWKLKASFANACNFCSMLPFHLEGGSEKKAVGIYLRGLELFDELIQ